MSRSTLERIAAMSKASTEKLGCIDFTGRLDRGYGRVKVKGETVYASRIVLEAKVGRKLVKGEWALHTCDRSRCVNPEHLYVGDHTQNQRDVEARGTAHRVSNRPAKIIAAKEMRAKGVYLKDIAALFSVTIGCIAQWTNDGGLKKGKRQSKEKRAKILEAKRLTKLKVSRVDIAKRMGVSPSCIGLWVRTND